MQNLGVPNANSCTNLDVKSALTCLLSLKFEAWCLTEVHPGLGSLLSGISY